MITAAITDDGVTNLVALSLYHHSVIARWLGLSLYFLVISGNNIGVSI